MAVVVRFGEGTGGRRTRWLVAAADGKGGEEGARGIGEVDGWVRGDDARHARGDRGEAKAGEVDEELLVAAEESERARAGTSTKFCIMCGFANLPVKAMFCSVCGERQR